jgi:hypothetical protein
VPDVAGFAADLPAIGAAATSLRAATDALTVDVTPPGDVGPGRLGPAVAALLRAAEADLGRARTAVADLSDAVDTARDTYAELDTDAATRFDHGP